MARRSRGGRFSPSDRVRTRVRDLGPILVVVGLALAVLAGLAVLPARTWLTQREDMNETQAELERMEAEVADLQAELEMLEDDAEIERRARANFGLVYPGEESYRILPPEEGTTADDPTTEEPASEFPASEHPAP